MITVVHVITKLELGGAQENTLYTCQHLDRDRFRVVLVYGPGGLLDSALDQLAASAHLIAVPELIRELAPKTDAACFSTLRRIFWEQQAAHWKRELAPHDFIVHTHSSKAGVIGRLAARAAEVPHVVHTIHGFGFHPWQPRLTKTLFVNAERAAGRVTHAFIGVSRANLAEARARGIIPPRAVVRLIRSGMDIGEIRRASGRRKEVRRSLNLGPEAEVILSVANFKPQKDPLTMIEAFAALRERRPRARLLFAGDGPLRREVEAAVQQRKLDEHVRLLGWRRDVPDLLAACDVVALSSLFEGLPRSAVQAVAARRPFVGTRVDGTPEIIRDGKNGYLVEPRNPEALAQALDRALVTRPLDPQDEVRIGEWDGQTMVREQESLYAGLVTERGKESA